MHRRIIGITGPPGAGKSTYAERLASESEEPAVVVPMDGFHLAETTLRRLGLLDRKGAPETFDPDGYAVLLHRLRDEAGPVYAPGFDRVLGQPVAGAIAVGPDVRLVITEGNYLLLDVPAWRRVRGELDEVWYVDVPDDVRRQRLVDRHVAFGKSPFEARAWVGRVDESNARLVAGVRHRADRVVAPS